MQRTYYAMITLIIQFSLHHNLGLHSITNNMCKARLVNIYYSQTL